MTTTTGSRPDGLPTDRDLADARQNLGRYDRDIRLHVLAGHLIGTLEFVAGYLTDPDALGAIARARAVLAAYEELR